MTIIVFEGPDESGKTTIAKVLSKELDIPYFKHDFNDEYWNNSKHSYKDAIKYDTPYFIEYLFQCKPNVIIDRFYPSEYVYAETFRSGDTDKKLIKKIDDVVSVMRDFYMIICYKDSYEDSNSLKLKEKYMKFAKLTKTQCLLLNTTDEDLRKQINMIKAFITKMSDYRKYRETLAKCKACFKMVKAREEVLGKGAGPIPAAGRIDAEYFFVGIAPGRAAIKIKDSIKDKPFAHGSGDLLRRTLTKLNIYDKSFISNVLKCNTPSDNKFLEEDAKRCMSNFLEWEIAMINPRKIIILGKQAKKYFDAQNYNEMFLVNAKVHYLKHPAYYSRNIKLVPFFEKDLKKVIKE